MDLTTILTMIIVTVCIGLAGWCLYPVIMSPFNKDRKKLQERLASEGQVVELDPSFKAIRRKIEVTGVSGYLVQFPGMDRIHRSLEQAWPGLTLVKFVSVMAGLGVGVFFIVWAVVGSLLIATVVGGIAGWIPYYLLSARRAKRQKALAEQLPEALEFLGRVLRAGHSLATGLQMIGQELPDPLASVFTRAYDAHSLGTPLEEALKEGAMRVESTDFGFFVTAVLIQRQTGGDLSEVLQNISGMIRGRIRLAQQVRAKTAEGRFTGYILTAFPGIMFLLCYILNPQYAKVLLGGRGIYLLATAGGLCAMGLYTIKKITTVKV